MEISNQKKLSKHIFRLLKVTDITYPIGRTSKGNLGIRFTENGEDFDIMLDSIPLSTKDIMNDDNNIELKKMLDKYLFEQEGFKFTGFVKAQNQPVQVEMVNHFETRSTMETVTPESVSSEAILTVEDVTKAFANPTPEEVVDSVLNVPKRRGRPAGSKNKIEKAEEVTNNPQ